MPANGAKAKVAMRALVTSEVPATATPDTGTKSSSSQHQATATTAKQGQASHETAAVLSPRDNSKAQRRGKRSSTPAIPTTPSSSNSHRAGTPAVRTSAAPARGVIREVVPKPAHLLVPPWIKETGINPIKTAVNKRIVEIFAEMPPDSQIKVTHRINRYLAVRRQTEDRVINAKLMQMMGMLEWLSGQPGGDRYFDMAQELMDLFGTYFASKAALGLEDDDSEDEVPPEVQYDM